jgi:Arc/MetJ family transcription regulator
MRTTLSIDEDLLKEAEKLSGAKTKKETVEMALEEFVRRRKSRKLVELEGKIELSYSLSEFLKRREKDVPYR